MYKIYNLIILYMGYKLVLYLQSYFSILFHTMYVLQILKKTKQKLDDEKKIFFNMNETSTTTNFYNNS